MKFKDYNQQQGLCLPSYLDDLIPENHVSRIINSFVDLLSMKMLVRPCKANKNGKGGNSPYHPKMMLKILIYAYTQGIFSSRKIEKQLHDSITFMWLNGYQTPDLVTISRYRSKHFVEILPVVLADFVFHI
ncbi:MAG: transposase [Candidatus Stygibacter australis]|nr:transposase [Candidatus Stygibacter australis]MDP8322548.1 transposase [Candidatus Stygibacter australis]